jgi:hypothetical protein
MCVLNYERRQKRIQLFSIGSYWVTKVEFTSTVRIEKQSNDRRSGRAHNNQEQKMRGRSGVQQRACPLLRFSTRKGLFTVKFFS